MIIIDIFFFIVAFFFLLPAVLGALLWFKVRTNIVNPFQAGGQQQSQAQNDPHVIEGQYEVVDEDRKGTS